MLVFGVGFGSFVFVRDVCFGFGNLSLGVWFSVSGFGCLGF